MLTENIVAIAITFFLLLNLVGGYFAGKKVCSVHEYAVANKSLGAGPLIITLIATMIGAKYVGIKILDIYKFGLAVTACQTVCYIVASLSLGRWVFPKLFRFKSAYTLGGIMGQLYGRTAQIFTGIVSIVFSVLVIMTQLVVMGGLCTKLGLSREIVIFSVGSIVTLYTFSGGMRSVTLTDMLQLVLIVTGFVLLANRVTNHYGGLAKLLTKVKEQRPTSFFVVEENTTLYKIMSSAFFLSLYPTIFLCPPMIQRVLMVRNPQQMKRVMGGFSIFYPLLRFLIVVIGMGLVLCSDVENIKEDGVLPLLEKVFFSDSSIGKVLLSLMLIGVVMSTADSFLNALVVVGIEDIIKPLWEQNCYKKKNEMNYVRCLTLLTGSICTLLAVAWKSVLPGALVTFALGGLATCTLPFIVGVMGLKGDKKSFAYSVITFWCVMGVVLLLGSYDYLAHFGITQNMALFRQMRFLFPIPLVLSGVTFFVTHYMVNGGWALLESSKSSQEYQITPRNGVWHKIFTHPMAWGKDQMERCGSQPTGVGFFLIFSYMLPAIVAMESRSYSNLDTIIRVIGVTLCVGLILHTLWNPWLRRYFPFYWFITLGYCLPFNYMFLFWHMPNDNMVCIQLLAALVLLNALVDRQTFLVLLGLGLGLSLGVYHIQDGTYEHFNFEVAWEALVGFGSTLLVLLLFANRKTEVSLNRVTRSKVLASAFGHELRGGLTLLQPTHLAQLLTKCTQAQKVPNKAVQVDPDTYQSIVKEVEEMKRGFQLCKKKTFLFEDLVQYDYIKSEEIVRSSVKDLTQKLLDELVLEHKDSVVLKNHDTDFQVQVVPALVYHVLHNLVKNAFFHGRASKVTLYWNSTKRKLYVQDNGKGIPLNVQPYMFDLYYHTTGGRGIGLPFVKLMLEAMEAKILFETSEHGTTFCIVFPPL